MPVSRRTRNSLASLSDEDIQRVATASPIVESSAASNPQPAVHDSSSTSVSSPVLTASTNSTQLLASSFGTTRMAQQLPTASRPTAPSGSDLLRASSLLLHSGAVLPASSPPLPYLPPNTWSWASFAYVPPPMALIPGVSTSGSSQVQQQSFSPPPSLFTFPSSSAVQPVSQAPSFPQSADRAQQVSADNALWRLPSIFPSAFRYSTASEPARFIPANVVPSLQSSLGPAQVVPQVAGPVQPTLLHSAQPKHEVHDATGMPLSYSSLRAPAFQQDFVVGQGLTPSPTKR